MNADSDLHWLAGLIEGEGCFTGSTKNTYFCPEIRLTMNDLDIIERAAAILNPPSISKRLPNQKHYKDGYVRIKMRYGFVLKGAAAIEWMERLYPFMGQRRQEAIRNVLQTKGLNRFNHPPRRFAVRD